MALGDSLTLGRLRFRIGDGCCVVVKFCGGVGMGGRSISADGRGEDRSEGAYVVTLNRDGG